MIDPHFFTGFIVGTFTAYVVSTVIYAVKYRNLWELKESMRKHPTAVTVDPDLEVMGQWGSAYTLDDLDTDE